MLKKTYTKMSVMVHCTNYTSENDCDIDCLAEYVTEGAGCEDYVRVTINDVTFFMTPAQYIILKSKIVDLK